MAGIQILLIEDNPGDVRLIEEMLADALDFVFGIQTQAYLQQAIHYLQAHKPDVILLDLSLPDSQGHETLVQLQDYASHIPIVVLTGAADESLGIKMLEHGAQDYLIKGQFEAGLLARSINYSIHRKRAEETLRETQRLRLELETEKELRLLKDRFIEMISHELRTPLTKILSSVSLLEMRGDQMQPEKRQRHYQIIQSATIDMSELVSSILSFQAQPSEIAPVALVFPQFIQEIVGDFELMLGGSHTLQFTSEGDPIQIKADGNLLKQAIINLLSNAAKYSQVGSVIQVMLISEPDKMTLAVRDEGIGISAEDQAYIFDMMYRGRNTGTVGGIGVGLAFARQAVELHHGSIHFTSQLGQGSTFTITLPRL